MPQQLLLEAIEQAKASAPAVRAMALLHIARVQTAWDRDAARATLDRALIEIESLPVARRDDAQADVVALVAAVAPDRAFQMLPSLKQEWRRADAILYSMLNHGHMKEAVAYLGEPLEGQPYASGAMLQALGRCREDPEAQRTILRGAVKAIRREAKHEGGFAFEQHNLIHGFVNHWRILPKDEAVEVIRELATRILEEPDGRTHQRFPHSKGDIRFSSSRQCRFFEILGPLRALDPERADALIREHAELAKAAAIYPNGFTDVMDSFNPATTGATPAIPEQPIDWDEVNFRWIPASEWLTTTFETLFDRALRLYSTDTAPENPNRAPKEVWPSTQHFRHLMYRAARHDGEAAKAKLDRIPDSDLQLFAKIEVAAALAGLDAIGGTEIPSRPPEPTEAESQPALLDLTALPARWKERGNAREVRTEFAEWNSSIEEWSVRSHATESFRSDGLQSNHTKEYVSGSSARVHFEYDAQQRLASIRSARSGSPEKTLSCSYERGRLVRVANKAVSTPVKEEPESWGFGGFMDWVVTYRVAGDGFKVDDAESVSIRYNGQGQPIAFQFYGGGESLLCSTQRIWNASGLLEREELTTAQPVIAGLDEEDRDEAFGGFQAGPSVATFRYDDHANCVERVADSSGYRLFRITSQHDELGNPIQESVECHEGTRKLRYAYRYDTHANWIERVIQTQAPGDPDFQPTSVERRQIEYY